MNFANGNTGKASELGLALARICMPFETCPPQKVVFGIHPGVIRVAVTCHELRGPHSDQGGLHTHHFALTGEGAKELLETFYDDQEIESSEITIEANRVVTMTVVAPLEEEDESLVNLHSLIPMLETFTVERRNSETE